MNFTVVCCAKPINVIDNIATLMTKVFENYQKNVINFRLAQ
jgi:hypothetical protein